MEAVEKDARLLLLRFICDDVVDVEEGLMNGDVTFTYDNQMSAMKPGHPATILDAILHEIFFDVMAGTLPEDPAVKNVLDKMITFREIFEVEQLDGVIESLKDYVDMAGL